MKRRMYLLKYSDLGSTIRKEVLSFKSKNDAYIWIYSFGWMPLSVTFKGWQN